MQALFWRADKERKAKPGRSLLAIVLPHHNKKAVLVVLEGPHAEVEAATADFKNMVETAVKERGP